MKTDILLGLQWGDEGKGKVVDVLAPKYDIVARFQGGPNAGHTLEINGKKHVLHTIPSGIFHANVLNVIGNGVVIDPISFVDEVNEIEALGVDICKRLILSKRAHLILPTHRLLDAHSEALKGKKKIGSTLKGIAPAYMDKTGRNGLRIGDILEKDFPKRYKTLAEKHKALLGSFEYDHTVHAENEKKWMACIDFIRKKLNCVDTEYLLNDALKEGKKILAEGAQGSLLDIDFGSYPYVTSSSTTCAGACIGLGIPPSSIGQVEGVFKAYCTRVGSGPFPTELNDAIGEKICTVGREFGSTTGRKRRCGWLDLPALKRAIMLNGVTKLDMMKVDVLNEFDEVKVCTHYIVNGEKTDHLPYNLAEEIKPVYRSFKGWGKLPAATKYDQYPAELKEYIQFIEESVGVPVKLVSTGPDRTETLIR
ncbi:MAG TPA: adenylosuccinate synthase [Bacteroidia bacterium]|jgi:adenylosuccinate synthase|nr:adenylosuccinate synthase [Bacteroidia bacterium]